MGTSERRKAILKILCRRKHETVHNLAVELGVSERTIRRDIDVLSVSEPIYTQVGRYGGGVYVVDGYTIDRMYMTDAEIEVLKKLYLYIENVSILTSEEKKVLSNVISLYSKPKLGKEKELI